MALSGSKMPPAVLSIEDRTPTMRQCAAVKIAGVRYDLKLGRANTISINANALSAGKKSKKLKKGKVCS